MNKATFSRFLKSSGAGKTLQDIKVLDKTTGVVYKIRNIVFDETDNVHYIEVIEEH